MEITKDAVQQEIEKRKVYSTNLKIFTTEEFERSQIELLEIKNLEKQIDLLYDDSIKAAKKALDTVKEAKDLFAKPLKEIKDVIAKAQREYYFELDRRRKEEQARIEKERKEAEEKKRLEEALKLEEEKKKLESEGRSEEAKKIDNQVNEILEKPIEVQKVEIKPEIKVDLRSFKKKWKVRIIDADKIPREYMMPDEKKLLDEARIKEEKANVPGVEFYYE